MSPVDILFIAKMLFDNNVLLYSLSPCGRVQVITVTTPIGTHMDCRRLSEPWLPFPTMWASSLVQRTESIHRGV